MSDTDQGRVTNRQHHYFVMGRGDFPLDMLRYDKAQVMGTYIAPWEPHPTLYLIFGLRTIGRWNSFLWSTLDARHDGTDWQTRYGSDKWETVRQVVASDA